MCASRSPACRWPRAACSSSSKRASASRSAMRNVRGTIEHLVGVGRFEDVRVFASATDQGVALRWQLVPVRRITRITVAGNHVLPAQDDPPRDHRSIRRDAVDEPHRRDDPSAHGLLPRPRLSSRPRSCRGCRRTDPAPEESELVLTIDAGPRLVVGAVTITGKPLDAEAEVIRLLGLQPGRAVRSSRARCAHRRLRRIAARARLLQGARARIARAERRRRRR